VIATARAPARADALAALAARSPGVAILPMDVADDGSVAGAAAALAGRRIDVLVNNAGVMGPKGQGVFALDPGAFLDVLQVNTVAPFRVLAAFRRALASPAKVVTMTSTMGAFAGGGAGYLAYRASKAALNRGMLAAAGELRGHGITAVVMHPGWVRTDMGGPGATLAPDEAARGIAATIDRIGPGDAGRFLNWDGGTAEF
jgi:NAD(P)-dependent dehydrogenase (short-subunit alcohol dehydrogenase family)